MILKFPTTLKEYTNGNLWNNGTKESIAKRIVYGMDKIDNQKELAERKFYLARFYYDKGCYDITTQILKELLLDTELVQESLILMQKCALKAQDAFALNNVFKLMSSYIKNGEEVFFDNMERSNIVFIDNNTNSRKVDYNDGYVEYYKDDKLLYKFFDNDYYAFVLDAQARQYLVENNVHKAIETLDKLKQRHLKEASILAISMTYLKAFNLLNDYKNAYEYAKPFMERNLYFEPIIDLFLGAKEQGLTDIYDTVKEFLARQTNLTTTQLVELFALHENDEKELWDTIYSNNPFADDDISEARYILEGVNYYNQDNLDMAKKSWHKADSLYGLYSKARKYLFFAEQFGSLSQNGGQTINLDKFSIVTESISVMLLPKLLECKTKQDFIQNNYENMLALNYVLSKGTESNEEMVNLVYNIAKMQYAPAMSMLSHYCTYSKTPYLIKIIILANHMLFGGKYKFIYDYAVRKNSIRVLPDTVGKEKIKYALAIYYAYTCMMFDEANDKYIKKIYWALKGDYRDAPVMAVLWILLRFHGLKFPEADACFEDKQKCKEFLLKFIDDMQTNIDKKQDIKMCDKLRKIAVEALELID